MTLSLSRQTLLAAAIAFLAAFCLYTRTLSPAFHPDDSPETITAGATLSLQHPPGYPLHALLGRAAALLGPGGPAFDINLLAAFCGALAIALAMLCLFEVLWELAPWGSQGLLHLGSALGMALALACTQTLWFQATIAKGGIYTLNLALTFATLYCVLQVRKAGLACPIEQLRGQGAFAGRGFSCGCPGPGALRLAGLFFGLGFANHWTSQVVLLPGYGLLLAESRLRRDGWPRPLDLLRIAFWPLLFAALGVSLYLYLPLRSRLGAPLVWGETDTLSGLWWVFSRSQYAGVEAGKTLGNIALLLGRIGQNTAQDYTWAGVLALAGGWALLFRRRPYLAGGLFLLPLTLAVAVATKANPPLDSLFIIDPYLIPVHVGLGLGLAGWGAWADKRRWLGPAFLAGALALGTLQWRNCDHAFDFIGYDYVKNLFLSVPRNALLFCEGDSNTAGPFYLRFVQGRRKDVTLISAVLCDYPWYRRSLGLQDPTLKQPPQPLGPPANMAWMALNNAPRPAVWTNSYTKTWADPAQLLHRGLVLLRQAKAQPHWSEAQLVANRVWPAYALRGVFLPYQRRQDPITVRLVQDNYVEGQARLAQALMEGGISKAAAQEFRLLGVLKPGTAPAWVQAGNVDYQAHDLKAAGEDWQRAVAEDPASVEAQANLALYYYDSGDYDQALSYANKALKLNPQMANAAQIRALALQKVGSPGASPAARPQQSSGVQYALEADKLAQGADPGAALAAYNKAVQAGFVNAGVHRNRGVMLMRLSRNAEAVDALNLAIALEPKNAELYRYLGILLYNSGKHPEGVAAIKKSAQLDPKNSETQILLKQLGPTP